MGSYKFKKHRIVEKTGYIIRIFFVILILPFVRCFLPEAKTQRVWLIGLEDDIYANNGKVFYEYIRSRHREISIYWVCERENKEKLASHIEKNHLISRGSVRNYIFAAIAEAAIYGFSDYDVAPGYFRILKRHKAVLVNISHGYDGLKGMPADYYKRMPADIICAASGYEQRIKIENCGADESKVCLTGFARYDQWNVDTEKNRKVRRILIMPTWRDWYESEGLDWKDTAMYKAYGLVLKKLDDMAESYKFQVAFHFHPRMKAFFANAGWDRYKNISMAPEGNAVQKLLTESDLLISDYSSIFWDAVYMNKKVILYWFDEKEYGEKRGLMRSDLVQEQVVNNEAQLFARLTDMLEGEQTYDLHDKYFDWQDHHNCERIYEAIQKQLR